MYNIPILAPTVPEGFCSTLTGNWIQQLANLIVGKAVAQLDGSGFSVIISQEAVPGSDQITSLWNRPSQAGRGIYSYISGAWVVPHLIPPNSPDRRWWSGTLVDLRSYDGGDGSVTVPAANVGAMWEEDTGFQGRSPMGPGIIPTSNPSKTLSATENYGEGAHTQTSQEVGPHAHKINADPLIQDGDGVNVVNTGFGGAGLAIGLTGPALTDLTIATNTYLAGQQSMPVIHPVRGLYCIMRTARQNYVGS